MALQMLAQGVRAQLPASAAAALGPLAALANACGICSSSAAGGLSPPSLPPAAACPAQHPAWSLQQRRGFRAAATFSSIDSGSSLEDRRRAHVARHTVSAAEALQVSRAPAGHACPATSRSAAGLPRHPTACRHACAPPSQAIPAGPHRILLGSGAAEPGLLVQALMARGRELSGSEIVHLLTLGPAPYVEPPHRWGRRLGCRAWAAAARQGAALRAGGLAVSGRPTCSLSLPHRPTCAALLRLRRRCPAPQAASTSATPPSSLGPTCGRRWRQGRLTSCPSSCMSCPPWCVPRQAAWTWR